MKRLAALLLLALAACTPARQTTQTVSNVVMGPPTMAALPSVPEGTPTGQLSGRVIENVMVDVAQPPNTDYGLEDNPMTGIKGELHSLFKGMGYSVYVSNGAYSADPVNMHNVLASDTAVTLRTTSRATVPDAILRVDWREDRSRNPLNSVSSFLVGARSTLQARASLWGPDGKLVWAGDVSTPVKRASFVTGGSVRNQFRTPATRAGAEIARQIHESVKGYFVFAQR